MSTPLADERLVSHAGSPSRSRNFKELQLSTDSTLSPSGTNNSSNQETESDGENRKETNCDSEKSSPTDQKILSNLKDFNIDRSAYKHYGHQSLLHGEALDKIITEAKVSTRRKSMDEGSNSSGSNIKEKRNGNSIRWDSSNRILIDQKISQILGIPAQAVDEESIWPYSAETLNEILRYKSEQEKTKQETIKNDFGVTAIELLKLAKSLNISGDLIPFLFVSNTTIEELKSKINELKSDPNDVINKINKLVNTPEYYSSYQNTPSTINGKRRYSESRALPSFSETAESIKSANSVDISPARSPNKLPSSAKFSLGESNDKEKGSPSSQNDKPVMLPIPTTAYLPHQQSQPQNGMYTMYYTHGPQSSSAPPPQQSLNEQSHENTSSTATTVLGSPYSLKYPPVMYQQHQNYHAVSGPSYIPQQHPYPYYMASSPSNGPPSHQYMMHPSGAPPPGLMQPMHPTQIAHHSPDIESRRSHSAKHLQKDEEEFAASQHHNKRHKVSSTAKTSSINFMITTPKNPPAKKYNNTQKDSIKDGK
ncbi:uncharacterized protein AC631_00742 [Debaryomyces fabryi]|uniref:Uncharacterized protein n=1 Tax=Debaryomyces fabryi TaxID=58627 RepID=A0A0V1Q4N9_9ASCO|nr:uncharacterized protein AC631_00742 [Debaryomyces fabryi]KSA03426.1 hypothetical protein AC631_00742 [Debaryomyces fabryi]CUM53718.1 unnamed protein product [Debaryomyces fabryi]